MSSNFAERELSHWLSIFELRKGCTAGKAQPSSAYPDAGFCFSEIFPSVDMLGNLWLSFALKPATGHQVDVYTPAGRKQLCRALAG